MQIPKAKPKERSFRSQRPMHGQRVLARLHRKTEYLDGIWDTHAGVLRVIGEAISPDRLVAWYPVKSLDERISDLRTDELDAKLAAFEARILQCSDDARLEKLSIVYEALTRERSRRAYSR